MLSTSANSRPMPPPKRPRAKSSTSLISEDIRRAWVLILDAMIRWAGSVSLCSSSSPPANTACKGLRRSWPKIAMNCSRSSFVARSSSNADCSRSRVESCSSWDAMSAANSSNIETMRGSRKRVGFESSAHSVPKCRSLPMMIGTEMKLWMDRGVGPLGVESVPASSKTMGRRAARRSNPRLAMKQSSSPGCTPSERSSLTA